MMAFPPCVLVISLSLSLIFLGPLGSTSYWTEIQAPSLQSTVLARVAKQTVKQHFQMWSLVLECPVQDPRGLLSSSADHPSSVPHRITHTSGLCCERWPSS